MYALIRAASRPTVPQFTIITPRTNVRGVLWFTATSPANFPHCGWQDTSPPKSGEGFFIMNY